MKYTIQCHFTKEQSDILTEDMILDIACAMEAYTNWDVNIIDIDTSIEFEDTIYEYLALVVKFHIDDFIIILPATSAKFVVAMLSALIGSWFYCNKIDCMYHQCKAI